VAKKDNVNLTLMTHCRVKLLCDGEKLDLIYGRVEGSKNNTWVCNGEDTGLQVLELIKMLREKYKSIRVAWKRQH
jgi:hypothetical protein